MNIVPAGVLVSFEVTYDNPSLFVAMTIYDMTNSPSFVSGPTAMTHLINNTYYQKFSATLGRSYLLSKAVYTDGTYTTLDLDYSSASETIYAANFSNPIVPIASAILAFIGQSQINAGVQQNQIGVGISTAAIAGTIQEVIID